MIRTKQFFQSFFFHLFFPLSFSLSLYRAVQAIAKILWNLLSREKKKKVQSDKLLQKKFCFLSNELIEILAQKKCLRNGVLLQSSGAERFVTWAASRGLECEIKSNFIV